MLPDVLSGEAYLRYLEALDERIIREMVVRLGANGDTSLRAIGVETSRGERNAMNFPRYMLNETLSEYIDIDL